MEKNNSETIEPIETAIDINADTKSDIFEHKGHREHISSIIVPQYIDDQNVKDNNYVVTYSYQDKSFLGWEIDIEENGQQPDVYVKLKKDYDICSAVLYKKTLLFCYYDDPDDCYCKYLF